MATSNPNERMRFCTRCKTNIVWRFEKKGEVVNPMTGEVLEYRRLQRICSCNPPIMGVVEMTKSTLDELTTALEDLKDIIAHDDRDMITKLSAQWSGQAPPPEPPPDEAPPMDDEPPAKKRTRAPEPVAA